MGLTCIHLTKQYHSGAKFTVRIIEVLMYIGWFSHVKFYTKYKLLMI